MQIEIDQFIKGQLTSCGYVIMAGSSRRFKYQVHQKNAFLGEAKQAWMVQDSTLIGYWGLKAGAPKQKGQEGFDETDLW